MVFASSVELSGARPAAIVGNKETERTTDVTIVFIYSATKRALQILILNTIPPVPLRRGSQFLRCYCY